MPDLGRLAILTTGRQDYGILRSTIRLLASHPRITTLVWAGGMHCSPRFGRTLDLILADGVRVARELPFLDTSPDPVAETARALAQVGRALEADRPEALMLVGDRSETAAAALAAVLAHVPIAHLHGGEETEGAVDNVLRHAVTKLSHLHLVSHEVHARRVRQMGEDPASIVVVGAPGLDNRFRDDLPDCGTLEAALKMKLVDPVVLVTVHPATLGADPLTEVGAVAAAMAAVPATYVITAPNADAGGEAIQAFWERWVRDRDNARLVKSLGEARYWGLLRVARAALGNSSSFLIEAPAAGVPAVLVGDRQRGRLQLGGVTEVAVDAAAIAQALHRTIAGERPKVDGLPDGPAAQRVVAALEAWRPPRPPRKAFAWYPG